MKNLVLVFFIFQFSFSQINDSRISDKIYNSLEAFIAKPNLNDIKKLEVLEKNSSAKTKSEFLAIVILNCNLAFYQNQFGETNKAISSYEKAWLLYDKNKLSNYKIIEFCLKPLGNLYTIIGDYDAAENTIKDYYFIANNENDALQKYAAILNLSNVYQSTGRIKEAIILLENTIKSEKLSPTQKGNLYGNLGSNYLLSYENNASESNFLNAKKALEKALYFLKLEANQTQAIGNAYLNLSKVFSIKKDFVTATIYLENATTLFEKTTIEPRKLAKLFYEKALLLFEQKKYQNANELIERIFTVLLPNYQTVKNSLPNKNSLYAETVLLDALDLKATVYLNQNLPKKALECYSLSFYIETLFLNILLYENSKIISQIRSRNRTEKCIEMYLNLYNNENKNTYLEQAFQLCEMSKSVVLKNTQQRYKNVSRAEKIILQQLQNCNTTIIKEQQKQELASVSVINDAIKKQNKLMLLLKEKELKNNVITKSEINCKDLYAKLDQDNAILLEYFTGIYRTYIFTLFNNTISLKAINNDSKSLQKIASFIALFSTSDAITNDVQAYNAAANSVYNLLKIPKKSTFKNLIIIPDGLLNFLPFEALITKKSTTSNFSKMNYLVKDFIVIYNNSASFYFNAIAVQNKRETVLGVFPVFEKSILELRFSKKEMQAIKQNFEGKYLEKSNATFKNFKANALNYSVLHLCTHASAGNVETPASIKFYDQEIVYSELYNLNINPNLVVLSACETGLGKLYKAEGAMSVSRGFQMAGAQNILFSLWKVNDFTTSLFMQKFYTSIKKGDSYAQANHNAKMSFLNDKTISNTKKSPYYWSAFVYYGNLENSNAILTFYWVIGFLGITILLTLGYLYYKKLKKLNYNGRISKDFEEK